MVVFEYLVKDVLFFDDWKYLVRVCLSEEDNLFWRIEFDEYC